MKTGHSVKRDIQGSIRKLRLELKISQKELARKMTPPVDQSTISNWESGKTDISVWQLLDILAICGKEWSTYFGFLQGNRAFKDNNQEIDE